MCSRFLKIVWSLPALTALWIRLWPFRGNTRFKAAWPRRPAVALQICLLAACGGCSHRAATSSVSRVVASTTINRPSGLLRVCADPNNLPFSNDKNQGFENKIAELLARDLNERIEYTWWAQRRGFFRNTLKAGMCDVVIGVPAAFDMGLATTPYYRSSYVFVSRKDRRLNISSFDDPRLHELKIGVQMIGNDFSNAPPAHALSKRGIIENVKGFTLYGDYAKPNPPARIVDAVVNRDVDVAVVWGPLAGYFARQSRVPLDIVPVTPQIDQPFMPFVFDIAMGVRHGDQQLKDEIDRVLERRKADIDRILDDYGVPRLDLQRGGSGV
jgi:quinoprotein dehydrogenase-associated probable ABC transporter substrate-binding protein